MNPKRSLRFKLIVGFVTIALPLVCLLLYSNYTASNSVREQAAESNKSMITLYSNQIQTALGRESNFLYTLASDDADILSLNKMDYDSTEYALTKLRILNGLTRNHRFNSSSDIQFVYVTAHRDLIHTQIQADTYDETMGIQQCLTDLLDEVQPDSPLFTEWKIAKCAGKPGLIRIVKSGFGDYLGAWVRLDHLMVPLELIQLGRAGFAAFADWSGKVISGSIDTGSFKEPPVIDLRANYERLKGEKDTYVVVSNPIASTDVTLAAFIPEQGMLQNLSRFRAFLVWVPLFAFALLLLYLIYLNGVIIRPMNELVKAMRTLKRGDWKFRLSRSPSREFFSVNETFNDMAHQIQKLKINVYEEQIRAQQAELKHLQLQINPHFLLNSINVVYNLAQIKNFSVIQAMCLNLVKYFRFTTKTSQSFVMLAEEMEHMDSYLRIQQVRFPERITFRIAVEEDVRQVPVPPLLVQPFIENAVKYGFDFMEEPFHIEIQAVRDPDRGSCRIRIADNGSGFPPDVLGALRDGSYFRRTDDRHLGIWNSYHRLQFLYGREARLTFGNDAEGGALVELEIPLQALPQSEMPQEKMG
ncbi:cache domain-containing sensor histidine kinase [Cohnella nanjingensis]|uniref:Histidine kinase n=1 Tax=Cohnella nanjingensis TaxID=1387779 RepID=A0A7X0RR59_9BACL|nr:histidine kinase [Cohnella nanjingensis]MBB6672153.1 histidine kinase [Cohnella nanjingensis]